MQCKDLGRWLEKRDIHETQECADISFHLETCPHCRALYEADNELESVIGSALTPTELPRELALRIDREIDLAGEPPQNPKTFDMKKAGIAAAVLLMFVTGLILMGRPGPRFQTLHQLGEQAVLDHLRGNTVLAFDAAGLARALGPINRELGFQVRLPDLSKEGVVLLGGRLCVLGKCRAAYFVLEEQGNQGRTGSLFIMGLAALDFPLPEGSRFTSRIRGCDTRVWKDNGQVYAMVF